MNSRTIRALLALGMAVFCHFGHAMEGHDRRCGNEIAASPSPAGVIYKAWLFGNLSFPQIRQGGNLSLGHAILSSRILSKDAVLTDEAVARGHAVMVSAHGSHGVEKMPPVSDIRMLFDAYLEDSKFNIKYAVEVLEYPKFANVTRDVMTLELSDFLDRLQTDPKLAGVRERLLEDYGLALDFVRKDMREMSIAYTKSFKTAQDRYTQLEMSQRMIRKMIAGVAEQLERRHPELARKATRFGRFSFREPRSQAFCLAIALVGTNMVEAVYPDFWESGFGWE